MTPLARAARWALTVAALVAGLAPAAGCTSAADPVSPSDAGSGHAADPDAAWAALKPVADAVCGWLFRCCDADERAAQLGGATMDDCGARLLQSNTVNSYPVTLAIGGFSTQALRNLDYVGSSRARVAIDDAAVRTCAQSIGGQSCNKPAPADHCDRAPPPPTTDPCDPARLFAGQQRLGDECVPNLGECAPGLVCVTTPSYDTGVCVRAPAAGDACITDADCGSSLICDAPSGKCATGATYGTPCSFADRLHALGTEVPRCGTGLVCDFVSLTCTGAQCATGGSCTTDANCPSGTACRGFVCGMPASPGQSCTYDGDCDPAAGLDCTSTGCQLVAMAPGVQPLGAACNGSYECDATGAFCGTSAGSTSGTCQPKRRAGTPCDANEECWVGCDVSIGATRCAGSGPGDVMCHG